MRGLHNNNNYYLPTSRLILNSCVVILVWLLSHRAFDSVSVVSVWGPVATMDPDLHSLQGLGPVLVGLYLLQRRGRQRRRYRRQRGTNRLWRRHHALMDISDMVHSTCLWSRLVGTHRSRIMPMEFSFLQEKEFRKKYRFSKASFAYIDAVLEPLLNTQQQEGWGGRRESDQSLPSSVLIANSIRMLAGGSHHDIAIASGVHPSTLYKNMWRFIEALLRSDLGDIVFYYDDIEWLREQAETFAGISPLGLKCVGALDGLAVRVQRPKAEENPRDYRFATS